MGKKREIDFRPSTGDGGSGRRDAEKRRGKRTVTKKKGRRKGTVMIMMRRPE